MRHLVLLALIVMTAAGLAPVAPARANMAPPQHEFRLGLGLERTDEGFRVSSLEKGGTAERAGLLIGDVVLAIDGRYAKAYSAADVKSLLEDMHNWPVSFIIVRNREDVETILVTH
jgi:C-terminal processing protease CtpA/Prc